MLLLNTPNKSRNQNPIHRKVYILKNFLTNILQKNKIPIKHISVARLKKIITGNGRASKKQIKYMVSKFLGIKQDNSHIADALALAIAGFLSLKDNALQYIRKNPS